MCCSCHAEEKRRNSRKTQEEEIFIKSLKVCVVCIKRGADKQMKSGR
jgi:hypothetical protein